MGGGGGWGGGCRLAGSVGWGRSAPDESWLGTHDESWLGTDESWLGTGRVHPLRPGLEAGGGTVEAANAAPSTQEIRQCCIVNL